MKIFFLCIFLFLSQHALWCDVNTQSTSEKKIQLSLFEQEYIKKLPPIRHTGDPDWMPYESFTEDGHYVGVAADFLKIITDRAGIKIEEIKPKNWNHSVEMAHTGIVDMLSDTSESVLKNELIFLKSYLTDDVVIVANNDNSKALGIADLKGKRIGVVQNYSWAHDILVKYPELFLVPFQTTTEALTACENKKVDVVITAQYEAARLVFMKFNELHIAGDTGLKTNLAFGLNPKYKDLVPILNRSIDSLTDADRVNIKNKWMPAKIENNDYSRLIYLTLFFIGLLSVVAYAYRKLKNELEFRRKLQLELMREKNQFETLFTTSADGNTIVIDGKFILCNKAFADLLKMTQEEVIGKDPSELSPEFQPDGETSRSKADNLIRECYSKGQVRFEWIHKTSDKRMVWCDIVITKIVYNSEIGIYTQVRNIDDIKMLEESLLNLKTKAEQANVAKSQFLANMSHEIRTPMNAVLGFTELLEKSDGLNSEQQGYLRSIKSGAKNLLQIINDILDLSKIEAGKLQIKADPFDMRLFLEDLKSVFSPLSQAKGIEFYIQYPNNMPPTWIMDELRLRQIFFNLIGNAFKFTEMGSITVNVIVNQYKSNEQLLDVTLSVIDTGIGIAPQDIHKVFNDFEQSDDQDTRKYGGTGLGLAISQKLALAMGGEITLQSQLESGSQFSIHFPNVKCDNKGIEIRTIQHGVNYNFQPATILSVDDVELNLILIRTRLKGYPFEIIEARNGEEALEKLALHKIDLILLDLQMPIMDGYELKRRLIESVEYKEIPVIALTAAVLETDTAKLKGLGFNAVLGKPLSNEELVYGLSQFIACTKENDTVEAPIVLSNIRLEGAFKEAYISDLKSIMNQEGMDHDFSLLTTLVVSMEHFLTQHPHQGLLQLIVDLRNAIRVFDVIRVNTLLKILRDNL